MRTVGTTLLLSMLAAIGMAQTPVGADGQWPIAFEAEGYRVRVYTPQPEAIDGDRFQARAAVSLQRAGDKQPVFGAIWGEGLLAVDRATRLGTLQRFEVTDARFPDPIGQDAERIRAMLSRETPLRTRPIPIDWLVAALDSELEAGEAFSNDAPEIIYTERPSVLVFIDGEPEYLMLERPVDRTEDPIYAAAGTDIERVLNTPFLLLRYRKSAHYLHGSGRWFRANSVRGPYAPVEVVPSSLRDLAREVGTTAEVESGGMATVPDIVVRTVPAELLDLDGPPRMTPIQGTGLLYATNTDKDLFLEIATQDHYLLSAGRWYATRSPRAGPWRHVPGDALPADFARIPEGSPKDGVLAHVPGTAAAREAVRDSRIPQTATVDRRTATLEVRYEGEPVFERINGGNVFLAMNASTTVLRIDGRYHACDNAVWYDSASPFGPWAVSTEVPVEVNNIPPSSPAYHVRYVHIYDHTPDMVFVGYTPGYIGSYVQGGVVVLGTGFYYPRWPGMWYPRPFTWGFNMHYNPWMGWTFGYGWGWNWFYPDWMYGGWMGPWHWHGWGPYGWWGAWRHCPPWPGIRRPAFYGHRRSLTSGARPSPTASRTDLYSGQARSGVVPTVLGRSPAGTAPGVPGGDPARRPDARPGVPSRDPVPTPVPDARPGVPSRDPVPTPVPDTRPGVPSRDPAPAPLPDARPSRPSRQPTVTPSERDHFPGRDGTIYRRDDRGLERYQDGRWQRERPTTPQRPSARPSVPNPFHIQERRDRGDQRVRDHQHFQQRPVPAPAPPRMAPAPSRPAPAPSRPSPQRQAPSRGG